MALAELVLDLVETARSCCGYDAGYEPLPETYLIPPEEDQLLARYYDRSLSDLPACRTNTSRHPLALFVRGVNGADDLMGVAAEALTRGERRRVREAFSLLCALPVREWSTRGDELLSAVLPTLEPYGEEWYRDVLPDVLELAREAALLLAAQHGVSAAGLDLIRTSGARMLVEIAKRTRASDGPRAMRWYARAAHLGRAAGDGATVARAMIGTGNVLMQAGKLREAEGLFLDAADVARAAGAREVEGMAYHDLLALAIQQGQRARVRAYARKASAAYGTNRIRLPRLAVDIACWWVERGQHGDALPILRALLAANCPAVDRLLLLGVLGRAAGAGGLSDLYATVWTDAFAELEVHDGFRAVEAMLDLARGASALGDWSRAEVAVEEAHRRAKRLGAMELVRSVQDARDRISERAGAIPQAGNLELVLWSPDADLSTDLVQALGELVA